MKTNRRFLAAALGGLLMASCAHLPDTRIADPLTAMVRLVRACAHRPDTRIADLTREYVAGRISYLCYAQSCNAIYQSSRNQTSGWTSGSDSSSSDSSSGNSELDNRHEKETRDKAHADTYHPAPPPAPAGVVSPQPPPPPGRDR